MRVLHQPPSPTLAPYVKRLSIVESESGATRTLIPETGLVLGFRYRGAAVDLDDPSRPLPNASLSGLRHRARRMQTLPGSGIVLVTFREGKAARFFRDPLHELYGATIGVDEFLPRSVVERVAERVVEATDDVARFAELERFLLSRLGSGVVDSVVERAVQAVLVSRGSVRVGVLARDLGLSRDRFEKRFRSVVGASPKRLAGVVRLREAIARYHPGARLTQLAPDAGYFDQAHFTRDFSAFTGTPPKHFFESTGYC